jgi:hypothetical protein
MHYSLIRESKVVIEYNGRAYNFDAMANFNGDTSYAEYKSQRKTLHRKTNYADSRITQMDPSSLSLTLNLSSNLLEFTFFELLGMDQEYNTFYLPYVSPVEPKLFTVYIINPNGRCTMFSHVFCSAVDFSFAKELILLNISLEAAKFESVTTFPNGFSLTQGSVLPPSPVSIFSNGVNLPGIVSANFSFQQQCSWREQRSLHDIGTIYNNTRAIVNEMNASATLNFYLLSSTAADALSSLEPEYDVPFSIVTKFITVEYPTSRVTKRLSHSDVYTLGYDIIPMPYGDRVSITFNGEKQK